jgi:hypothetical protein
MRSYFFKAANANGAAKTHSGLANNASATKRLAVFGLEMFSSATADNACQVDYQRFTAAGTSTAVTIFPRDPADGTNTAAGGHNHTVEPTYTANAFLLSLGGHQRGTFVWFAQPGAELVVPVTNSNGVGAIVTTMATGFSLTMGWEYQE